jgi:DNA-directed RNA polymerase specialized sigma24 family protein
LDPDRRTASEKYEKLRGILVDFFSWEGALFPEDLADETLNRLAKRIESGENIEEINRYACGVARLVFRESLAEKRRWENSVREMPVGPGPEDPLAQERLACLRRCVHRLSSRSRDLILRYYAGDHRQRIEMREKLAKELGISMNAVRNRAMRIRDGLQACVERCMSGSKQDS